MNQHEKLNYVELPARDLPATRQFFRTVFGWEFEEFGPDYCAFAGQGLDGGFYSSELFSSTRNGSALLVFYSDDLEATQARIEQAGGRIEKPVFEFPEGRRFHFSEPSGNEFAVWTATSRPDP
jgi:predicted enzyme related to lactoylglutathione lyase